MQQRQRETGVSDHRPYDGDQAHDAYNGFRSAQIEDEGVEYTIAAGAVQLLRVLSSAYFSKIRREMVGGFVRRLLIIFHFSVAGFVAVELSLSHSECLLKIIFGEKTLSPSSPRAVSPSSFA